MTSELLVGSCPRLKYTERNKHSNIDIEELVVGKVTRLKVKHSHTEKLDHRVQFNEFECLESGGKGSSSLSKKSDDT